MHQRGPMTSVMYICAAGLVAGETKLASGLAKLVWLQCLPIAIFAQVPSVATFLFTETRPCDLCSRLDLAILQSFTFREGNDFNDSRNRHGEHW